MMRRVNNSTNRLANNPVTRRPSPLAAIGRRAAQWRLLAGRNRKVYVQTAALLAAIRLALWMLPFPALPRLIDRWVRPAPRAGTDATAVRERLVRVRAVSAMARYVPGATCLTQSLALFVLLKRLGDPAILKIGVAKSENGALLAHAWVETPDGSPLIAVGPEKFQPLLKFENAPTLP